MAAVTAQTRASITTVSEHETGRPMNITLNPLVDKWKRVDDREVEALKDRARQGIHCRVACGGTKCKHEDYRRQLAQDPPAIHGLHSSWVGGLVVASQRPSTSLFAKFDLIQQFKDLNVTAVFNLQEIDEHSSCGPDDGILPGVHFSYDGQKELVANGVSYYEFPWPDMTAPDNETVLRCVRIMDHHVKTNNGRVLVHCHAGLGRTGLMIACYFMYAQDRSPEEAINMVRSSRRGAIQTKKQTAFCYKFARCLDGVDL